MLIFSLSFGDISDFFEKWSIPPENILSYSENEAVILLYGDLHIPKKYISFSGRKKSFLIPRKIDIDSSLKFEVVIDNFKYNKEFNITAKGSCKP